MAITPRFTRTAAIVAVGAVSAFGLAACSTGDSGDSGAGGEPVTIEYLHRLPDGEGMTPTSEIVDRWNADHPDIQVKATKFDGKSSDMILKLETDVKAGNGPCLAQTGYSEVPQLFVKGLLQDVADEAKKYEDDFSAGAFSGMKVGDAIVGLPQDTGPLVYFYNETEFTGTGPRRAEDARRPHDRLRHGSGRRQVRHRLHAPMRRRTGSPPSRQRPATPGSAPPATSGRSTPRAPAPSAWPRSGRGCSTASRLSPPSAGAKASPLRSTTAASSATSERRGRPDSSSTRSTAHRPRASGASPSSPTSAPVP